MEKHILGIDVGALAIKATLKHGSEVSSLYRPHKGEPERAIISVARELCKKPDAVAMTGAGGRLLAKKLGIFYVDPAVALIGASKDSGVRHIIDIGGGSLSIVDLDEEGRFAGYRTNSLCAAGTGSFLDEQAARMKLGEDQRSAEFDIVEPPRIAARCAVFAKSDLIHRQQEGFSVSEMWSGLCRGMVQTALTTLFRGRRPSGRVLFAGGVALNKEVVRWLKNELEVELVIPHGPETFSSRGAIAAARPVVGDIDWEKLLHEDGKKSIAKRPRLELSLSSYPSFDCKRSFVDDATEVRIHAELSGEVVIGIDIGSTSTKAALLDMNGTVVADLYRRTSGDPIGATQKIFAAIRRAAAGELKFSGAATTGSGRKMVGAIIGADRVINEITAHARGAAAADPDVETILEIGGQDAKYVAMREGVPHDSNMNYVCAAGTGSFVEEQAGKLGFALSEIGDAVMGTEPPFSSDRCTVFMEQDVHALIRAGFDRREVMGSVLYSVVQNYLNKVVGRRPLSRRKICFMGATARNRGLVAAFERLLGAPVSVSPYCHVMGAYGVALSVLEEVAQRGEATRFCGLDFADRKVELRREVCKLCSNMCRITRAIVGDETDVSAAPSWGYMCGRDPDEKRVKVNSHFDAFRKRERMWKQNVKGPGSTEGGPAKTVGIPRSLLTFGNLPMWSKFFAELGASVKLSGQTDDETLAKAIDFIGSDYCYPVKLAHGHVRELALDSNVDFIFLPYIVQGEPHDDGFERNVYCPYNIAFPSILKSSGAAESKPIISPALNFQLDLDIIVDELHRELSPTMGLSRGRIEKAWLASLAAQRSFEENCAAMGKEALERMKAAGGKGVVLLGRPYNVCDLGANLSLPRKIADMGMDVFTVDMLPLSGVKIDPLFHNMYWNYGRKILQAATVVAADPDLHAVFLTNFGCGPDSFLQTYVEKIMRGKPMLMLELDEHSADAGYITRLEAFDDVISKEGARTDAETRHETPAKSEPAGNRRDPTLWIPPMHPYGTPFLAAALRSVGKDARPLPPETAETFEMAKRYCRGTECVPLPSTIGTFLKVLKESDSPENQRFFMPSAKGPCRFGQYHTLHRIILDEAGYGKTAIESWSDETGSYGMDMKTSRRLFNAMLAADFLYKARCRVRPYAKDRTAFDSLMVKILERVERTIEEAGDLTNALKEAARDMADLPRDTASRPLIGVVGEIYVRLNPFTNGKLVERIEETGGEAWVAPISEWFQYLAFLDRQKGKLERHGVKTKLKTTIKNKFMMRQEKILAEAMRDIIGDRHEPPIASTVAAGARHFPSQFDGESILTVGRAIEFAEQGVDLIINCAPFGCMPGTLTSGIFQRLERKMGVPVVSLFFDGESDLSHLVRTYLANVGCVSGKKPAPAEVLHEA
ncbi:MAG TPA: acyl-CoA dehydratase activase [bacterium]|nr:acyl-CoA dehydratase activase [bacterium]